MNKLHSAESLRGIACLAVVFSHLLGIFYPQLHNFAKSNLPQFQFAELIHNSPFTFFFSGTGAVFVFFVLSGYVLTLSSLRAKDKTKKLKESLIKRYPRLAIPVIFSCLLMYVSLHIDVDVSRTSEWFQTLKITPVFFNALYEGAIGSFIFGSAKYNPVLWTMQIELLGSLVIYFACFFQNKKIIKHIFLFFCIAASAKISALAFLGIISFILGHFLYLSKVKLSESVSILLLFTGLYLCGAHNTSESYALFTKFLGSHTYNVLNFAGGFLIVFATLSSSVIDRFLDKKPLVHLGKLSFSIYLIHIPIIYLIGIPVFNFALDSNISFVLSSLLSICVVLFSTIIFSEVYSRIFDDASIKISNKLSKLLVK